MSVELIDVIEKTIEITKGMYPEKIWKFMYLNEKFSAK